MNILIVEDARDQRLMLSVVLRKKGHHVLEADNGQAALDLLKQDNDVRIVISDWMMPEMDGIELLSRVRELELGRYVYFILLTGKTDHEAVVEGMNKGADDFLSKPVNFEELNARVNAGIRIIELEQQLESQNLQLSEAIETIEKDLESAAKAQEALLCQPATIQHVSFDWFFKPSKILGGDMFGYHPIDGETLGFYQLDVAGHGIPSALFSFTLNNVLSETSNQGSIVKEYLDEAPYYRVSEPDSILANLNNRFQATPESMLYFTIAYGLINSRTGQVTFAQAGHPAPLWIKTEKRKVVPLTSSGSVPIGMMPDMEYTSQTLQFQPGDRLFLYSDGVTECENHEGEQFGQDRLLKSLQASFDEDLKTAIHRVEKDICSWSELDRFDDDVTYLLLEWKP